jgi:hypothetical protein
MTKIKSNKEYTIKLNHSELGDFYYRTKKSCDKYNNRSYNFNYYFTQDINDVQTWKKQKLVEKKVEDIHYDVNTKDCKIFLAIDNSKTYYAISNITSSVYTEKITRILTDLKESLITDSKNIYDMIGEDRQTEDNFMSNIKLLENDLNTYRKNYSFLKKTNTHINDKEVNLSVVDASYGFRLLKLKKLNSIQNYGENSPFTEN